MLFTPLRCVATAHDTPGPVAAWLLVPGDDPLLRVVAQLAVGMWPASMSVAGWLRFSTAARRSNACRMPDFQAKTGQRSPSRADKLHRRERPR